MCRSNEDEITPRPCDALTRAAGYVVAALLGRRHPEAEEALAELCRLLEARVLAKGRGELFHGDDDWSLPRRLRAEAGERQRDLDELLAERDRAERECQRLEADLRAVASDRDGWRARAVRAESSRGAPTCA